MEILLSIRRLLKRKKPKFVKQDAHKKPKLSDAWRKPRGLQSKMRLKKSGYRRSISVGWKSPALVKGFNREGLKPVLVKNVSDLKNVKPKTDIVVISSVVGTKKKIDILNEAEKLSLKVENFKDAKKFIESKQKEIKANKEKKELKKKKSQEKVSKKDTVEKTKKKDEDFEDKKSQEKKERDKILTQKN